MAAKTFACHFFRFLSPIQIPFWFLSLTREEYRRMHVRDIKCTDLGQIVRHYWNKMIDAVVGHRVLAKAIQGRDLLNNSVTLEKNLEKKSIITTGKVFVRDFTHGKSVPVKYKSTFMEKFTSHLSQGKTATVFIMKRIKLIPTCNTGLEGIFICKRGATKP